MKAWHIPAFLQRLLLFTLLWLVLSGAKLYSVPMAVLGVLSATLFSLILWPPWSLRPRWRWLPRLVGYFLWSSLKGGVDIAWRALSPAMPLEPGLLELESRLENQPAVVLFAWLISLMPGTASVKLEDGARLTIHVVDTRKFGEAHLRELEAHIHRLLP